MGAGLCFDALSRILVPTKTGKKCCSIHKLLHMYIKYIYIEMARK
jgi:hypothetical protein